MIPSIRSPFEVREEDGKFVVVSDHDEEFCMTPDGGEREAYYACELLNRGFRMGYDSGDFRAKLAMRQAIGLS